MLRPPFAQRHRVDLAAGRADNVRKTDGYEAVRHAVDADERQQAAIRVVECDVDRRRIASPGGGDHSGDHRQTADSTAGG